MNPVLPPQVPSVDTAVGLTPGAAEEVGVAPPPEEGYVPSLPAESRYQFLAGSPKHSPTVTPLYPLSWMIFNMYSVRL